MPRKRKPVSPEDVASHLQEVVTAPPVEFVPDTLVQREFNVTAMCLWRWTRDPSLGFPPVIKIRKQNYRSREALEAFKQRMLSLAITERNKSRKSERVRARAEA